MDNIGQLSNSFEQMRRTIWQACHPNHEKRGMPATYAAGIPANLACAFGEAASVLLHDERRGDVHHDLVGALRDLVAAAILPQLAHPRALRVSHAAEYLHGARCHLGGGVGARSAS